MNHLARIHQPDIRVRQQPRLAQHLGCHGTLYVPNARGWYVYPVRTVRGALGASRPAPPVRTQRGRLVRVARTYPTEASGRTCQLSAARACTWRPRTRWSSRGRAPPGARARPATSPQVGRPA